jgi:hypothetical protein
MIEFSKYCQIKDNFCICYFGSSYEYILQIIFLKPFIEEKYKGIKIFIGCNDHAYNFFKDYKFTLSYSDLLKRKLDFAYIKELKFDGTIHPLEFFIKESEIENYIVCNKNNTENTSSCSIITKGNYPTISLNEKQINILKNIASQSGFVAEIDAPVENSGLVMGVESFSLFKAASLGIKTKLVPTGLGTNIYKKMFPEGEIIDV